LFDERNTIIIKLKINITKRSKKSSQAITKEREITHIANPRFLNTPIVPFLNPKASEEVPFD